MSTTTDIADCQRAYDKYLRGYKIKDRVPDAIWDFEIIRPPRPSNPKKIANWGKPKKERKFPYYSDDFIKEMTEYSNLSEHDDSNIKSRLIYKKFLDEEWRRRNEGFFFYNENILEYITGANYCTLQYWKIPKTVKINGVKRKYRGQPDFRDSQRDLFYALAYARADDSCAGLCYISNRRAGKTTAILSDGYWDTTGNRESRMAIQSKTKDDSIETFTKLVDSWKWLPIWFKPVDKGFTSSKSELVFGEPTENIKELAKRENKDVINSFIRPYNSKESALDGNYFSYIVNDEVGKSAKGLDINERWNINRECIFDGADVIGFGVSLSTVEDMDKYGSESFRLLWDRSESTERLPNGMTHSYMYQFFLPAYYGFVGESKGEQFVNEWGYSNIEAARSFHKKQYESLSGKDLMSYQRKYPITIHDVWVTTEGKNNFSTVRLLQQKIWNDSTGHQDIVQGNFMWENGVKWGPVNFYPDTQGRWLVAWQPREEDRNKWEPHGMQKKPTRNYCFTGIDPFSHGKVVDEKKGSNGAAVTILKSYPGSKIKEGVVCVYDYRQGDPNAQVEDMIMQCVYYSSPALIESNVSVAVNGFRDKGYDGYVQYNPLETDLRKRGRGLKGYATTSKESVENLISMSASYILDNIGINKEKEHGFCPFNDLIKQWMDFDPEKRTPYDLVMAAGLAIILMKAPSPKKQQLFSPGDWMPNISSRAMLQFTGRKE